MLGFLCAEFVDFAASRYGVVCEGFAAAPCSRDDCSGPDHLRIWADLVACRTGVPAPILLRGFGNALFGRLIRGYPAFFVGIDSTMALVTRYETQVVAEVRKLNDAVRPPHLALRRDADGTVEVVYRSTRGLADLAEGLLRGSIAHFAEALDVECPQAANDGSLETVFRLVPRSGAAVFPARA